MRRVAERQSGRSRKTFTKRASKTMGVNLSLPRRGGIRL